MTRREWLHTSAWAARLEVLAQGRVLVVVRSMPQVLGWVRVLVVEVLGRPTAHHHSPAGPNSLSESCHCHNNSNSSSSSSSSNNKRVARLVALHTRAGTARLKVQAQVRVLVLVLVRLLVEGAPTTAKATGAEMVGR